MRKILAFTAAVVAMLAVAAPAWAHEEINPKQFPTGQPTFFLLSAANEEKVDLTKVTVTAPGGVPFGSTTKSPTGWTVNRTDTVITWTGGAVHPDDFDQWGYEIEGADQPGTLTYKVTLGFADGKSDDVNVQVNAVAPGTGTTATTAVAAGSNGGGRTRANVALGLGAVAVVLSLVALGLAGRKRSTGPGISAVGGGAQKQDW